MKQEILDCSYIVNNKLENSDKRIIQTFALETFGEEYISLFKKMLEKDIIRFEDAKKYIRNFSRESYKLKFYQEKCQLN